MSTEQSGNPEREPQYQDQAQIDNDIAIGKYNLLVTLDVTADDAVEHFAQAPQADMLSQLYQTSHGNLTELRSVQSLADSLGRVLNLGDDEQQRLIVDEQPKSTDEEEYMRVWQLRESLTLLAWRFLAATDLPNDVKTLFSTNQDHLGYAELDQAVSGAEQWAAENPEQNIPIEMNDGIIGQIKKVHHRGKELIDFYNEKQPLLAVYTIPPAKPNAWSFEQVHLDRVLAVAGLAGLLGGSEREAAIMRQAGSQW